MLYFTLPEALDYVAVLFWLLDHEAALSPQVQHCGQQGQPGAGTFLGVIRILWWYTNLLGSTKGSSEDYQGFTGDSQNLLGTTKVPLVTTKSYLGLTMFYWGLPKFTGDYQDLVSTTKVLLGTTKVYWVLMGFNGF